MQKIYSIQYLRAGAALAVVLFHAAGETYDSTFRFGAAGVDVFFVISGFIMWTITATKPPSPSQFLRSRLTRIVPLYALMTLLLAMAAVAMPSLFPRLMPDLDYIAKSLLFIPVRSPIDHTISPLLTQGWSLNYEMFFYLIFALTLLLPKPVRLPVLTIVLSGLALTGALHTSDDPVIFTYTDPLLLEFLAGLVLGFVYENRRLPGRFGGWLCLSGGVLFGLLSATNLVAMPEVIAWGIPAVLLVAGLVTLEARGGIAIVPVLVLLGDASYSIYLTHGITLSVIRNLAVVQYPPLAMMLGLVASIAGGLIVWRYLERPMTEMLKSRPSLAPAV